MRMSGLLFAFVLAVAGLQASNAVRAAILGDWLTCVAWAFASPSFAAWGWVATRDIKRLEDLAGKQRKED